MSFGIANIESNLQDVPEGELLDIELPSDRHHGWRYIGFGPDDMLYISIGAPCNVCDEFGYAQIIRMNADGSGREIYASGIRNSVGFTWHPLTGRAVVYRQRSRHVGRRLACLRAEPRTQARAAFRLSVLPRRRNSRPEIRQGAGLRDYTPPAQKLGPHVAPLGLKFYTGDMFPAEYRNQVFIAEHGSWNRSKKIGYRVSLVRFDGNRAVSYEPFAHGWLQGQSVSGRPVDLIVKDDGSLLVSDDFAGKIYRISYDGAN